ncbi:hypothetical protein Scep_025797 [Stephania cephalantha]|uniref:Glycosyl-hydrolase family 116 N-terminal domain-containing protein n=1 Tax=Stephania cephalantha TaxID=152367 RepID=A0AAP0ER69_9MAGN
MGLEERRERKCERSFDILEIAEMGIDRMGVVEQFAECISRHNVLDEMIKFISVTTIKFTVGNNHFSTFAFSERCLSTKRSGSITRGFRGDFRQMQIIPGLCEPSPIMANQKPDDHGISSWGWNLSGQHSTYHALFPRAWTIYDGIIFLIAVLQ